MSTTQFNLPTSDQLIEIGGRISEGTKLMFKDVSPVIDLSKPLGIAPGSASLLVHLHHEWQVNSDSLLLRELRDAYDPEIFEIPFAVALNEVIERGYVASDEARRRKNEQFVLAGGVHAFLLTSDERFLQSCYEEGAEALFNTCMSWHDRSARPSFPGRSNPSATYDVLIQHRTHPLIEYLAQQTESLQEQLIALDVLGHLLSTSEPMQLERIMLRHFQAPVERMRQKHAWSNPDSVCYQRGILTPSSLDRGLVNEIRLDEQLVAKFLPKERYPVTKRIAKDKPASFVIIDPESIPEVPLHYTQRFSDELGHLRSIMQPDELEAYFERLRMRKLPASLTAMVYGAPGLGKTEMARQLARESGRELLIVNLSSIREKWFGESEKNAETLFDELEAYCQKASKLPIVLFNEADALFAQRSATGGETHATSVAIIGIFLNRIERFEGILMGTSNHTGIIDAAFVRRWSIKLRVPAPCAQTRRPILKDRLGDYLNDIEIERIAEAHAFTPAQADNVVRKFLLRKTGPDNLKVIDELFKAEVAGWSDQEASAIGFRA